MSGTSTDDLAPGRRAVTIADFRSSLAGGGATFAGVAVRFVTITGTSSRTGFFFRGGRL
jgi:hypothetical protein